MSLPYGYADTTAPPGRAGMGACPYIRTDAAVVWRLVAVECETTGGTCPAPTNTSTPPHPTRAGRHGSLPLHKNEDAAGCVAVGRG